MIDQELLTEYWIKIPESYVKKIEGYDELLEALEGSHQLLIQFKKYREVRELTGGEASLDCQLEQNKQVIKKISKP